MNARDSIAIGLSLSEIDALCRKAARGAGYPWGLAEEAGKAVRWLASYRLPGPELLAEHLSAAASAGRPNMRGCPIMLGATLSDTALSIADGTPAALGHVARPLLLLAQAGLSAEALRVPLEVRWTGFRAVCLPDGLWLGESIGARAAIGDDVICARAVWDAGVAVRTPVAGSYRVNGDAWSVLESLARRTYAPASEASRQGGAGAAMLDSD